jgi:hypothetical protein
MFTVPIAMPFTIPVVEPTVATAGLPLVHVPPAVTSERVVVEPKQMFVIPVIGLGGVTTFNVVVAVHAPVL